LNLLAMLVLGTVLERAVGSVRTVCVMGVSGIGAMLASGLFGNVPVVGASGIVFGLLGGVLWLEYRHTAELPAWWRLPRRSVIILLIINGGLGLMIPFIAWEAHAGGLFAGAIATAAVTRGITLRSPLWVQGFCASVLLATLLSVGTASMTAFAEGEARARFLQRLANLPEISPGELNDLAWVIATSATPTESELEVALRLAERAVSETGRAEATILDTLAEVQFALGQTLNAIATIDEAIGQDPDDTYYREQRKRFSGERDPNDRPEYVPPMFRSPDGTRPREQPQTAPGLTV
jgi:hypothetical protein